MSVLTIFQVTLDSMEEAPVNEARDRREMLRRIDEVLERLEMLHLANTTRVPRELWQDVAGVCKSLGMSAPHERAHSYKLMDMLFDAQDKIMEPMRAAVERRMADERRKNGGPEHD